MADKFRIQSEVIGKSGCVGKRELRIMNYELGMGELAGGVVNSEFGEMK